MLGLVLFISMLIVSLSFHALVLFVSARAAGSSRVTASRTVAAMVGLIAIGIVGGIAGSYIAVDVPDPASIPSVRPAAPAGLPTGVVFELIGLETADLLLAYTLLGSIFSLPMGKALIPLFSILLCEIGLTAAALLWVRPNVLEFFSIPTPSSAPTLMPGDRLFVDKLETPHRGDMVAYHARGIVLCKRLVAVPGDRIHMEGDHLFINDDLQPYAPPITTALPPLPSALRFKRTFKYADGQVVSLGTDDYFFVGDNMAASYDSRDTGLVHRGDLIGVVDLIYWPWDRKHLFR